MSCVSKISNEIHLLWDKSEEHITIEMTSQLCSTYEIVSRLAKIDGPIDVYCWYEGIQNLSRAAASFMKNAIFEPLFVMKKDTKVYLYSLKAWSFDKDVTRMSASTPIGDAINRINTTAVECLYASSFFKYCTSFSKEQRLYTFINQELIKKEWLFKLSESQQCKGVKVGALFANQISIFDCIKDTDVASAYALIQYIEGYYLIQESVKKGLLNNQKKITIAFVLPNDESKYYTDMQKDIPVMLGLDFGEALNDVKIHIYFQFFRYGDSLSSRPYINKDRQALKVRTEEIGHYFDYLFKYSYMPFLRDIIHHLNL